MSKNHYEMTAAGSAQLEIDYLRDELKKVKEKLKDVNVARALLRSKGYYVDNLWHVDDVMDTHKCSKDISYEVLNYALTDEFITSEIFEKIDSICETLGIKPNEE